MKNQYLILLSLCLIFSCEDDIREVSLFDSGETIAEASNSDIGFGESVRFTSTSTKALTTNWTFPGGSPATSINPEVTVTYTTPGTFEAQLIVKYIDNTIDTRTFTITVRGIAEPLPFEGAPVDIEGTIEAENFDLGGEGVGYHDTEEENLAVAAGSPVYRDDKGIDIEVDEMVTNIGYTNEGEWMNYTVNVLETGNYDFEFMVASGSEAGGNSIKLQLMDQDTGTVTELGETGDFENTGGWSVYTGITISEVSLSEGLHTLRVYFTGGGTNLDKINTTLLGATPPINGLGIYTEREITESNPAIIPPLNNANFVISEVGNAAHGDNALYYEFDPANSSSPQTWGAMATLFPEENINASSYSYYHISLKTTSTSNIRIRIKANGTNYWVTLNSSTTDETYGMARDGQWHSVKIPLADFNAPDLTSISEILVLRSDDADFGNTSPEDTERDYDWYVDDIYLTAE
ncbi:carbohydrate-binding protein [Sinomicrobium sp. M5D2P17]